jgi:xanthine dehydrogenase accessory factor
MILNPMTTDLLDRSVVISGFAAAYRENVIPDLASWSSKGERCALVTLVNVDGNAPRAEGAQMAVSESGRWAGYISGGCLEQAIALEAVEAIQTGKPRLLRYGKGSPYLDIRLPCGSGLDVFIQPMRDAATIKDMSERLERRQPFVLRIDLATGAGQLQASAGAPLQSHREGSIFLRTYEPALRCLIIGSSPIAVALVELAAGAGFEAEFYATDPESMPKLPVTASVRPLRTPLPLGADRWTAAILAFHDHDQEFPFFSSLLRSPCFFIGAIGSRNVHAARQAVLMETGFSEAEIARIKSPAGLLTGLKNARHIALSILMQIVAAAGEQGMAC